MHGNELNQAGGVNTELKLVAEGNMNEVLSRVRQTCSFSIEVRDKGRDQVSSLENQSTVIKCAFCA